MGEAYIVAAGRTAGGRRKGRLATLHPVDLAAQLLDGLIGRAGIDPALIEDVIMGCVGQAGEQSQNVARNAILASRRLPESVPGGSVDRQCGSSQQALHFATALVSSGIQDIVIASGVEHMTRVPMFTPSILAEQAGMGSYHHAEGIRQRYPDILFSQFMGAESVAQKYNLSKESMDEFALASHRKASAATAAKEFEREIVPIAIEAVDGSTYSHSIDEGIRADASLEAIAGLKPITPGGLLTAGTASQICDGASGVLIMNEQGLKRSGSTPMARIDHVSVLGHDPVIMLEAPIPATQQALKKCGLSIDDIDAYEINEAFASIPMAWLQATGADPDRLNRRGGAIALGHPLGASGTKLMSTLLNILKTHRGQWGLQVMCEGGGLANVTIVENLER
jgi:acetyl-CoA C-acetyltransferase